MKGRSAEAALGVAFVFALALLLRYAYRLPFQDTALWYIGAFVFFYVPGRLVNGILGFGDEHFPFRPVLDTAVGSALTPVLYAYFRTFSAPWALYPYAAVCLIAFSASWIGRIKKRPARPGLEPREALAFVALSAFVLSALHLSFFTDVRLLPEGFLLRIKFNETVWHLGIINALKDTYPPFFPYASGHGFSHYHLNMHLQIEMFNRAFHLDSLKLTYYYFPLLYLSLLVFTAYAFVRKYIGSGYAAVATGVLMLGSNLSYVPGLMGVYKEGFEWTVGFHDSLFDFLVLNGFTPAASILVLCVICIKGYFETGKRPRLLLFALLAYSAYGFKSSMGVQIASVALLTGAVTSFVLKDRSRGRDLFISSVLLCLAIALDIALLRSGTTGRVYVFAPFNAFTRSLDLLGIGGAHAFLYPLLYPLYMLFSYGARAAGFVHVRVLFSRETFDPVVFFLAVFSLSGVLLTEFLVIESPNALLNAAYSFSLQSLAGGWLLLSYFLAGAARRRLFWVPILAILISAPSSVQLYSLKYNDSRYKVDSKDLEVAEYLKAAPAHSVVLHPFNIKRLSLSSHLAGRQTVLNTFFSFAKDWIGEEEQRRRENDVGYFFDDTGVSRGFILKQYGVDYVYATLPEAAVLEGEPALREVFSNGKYVIYEVVGR